MTTKPFTAAKTYENSCFVVTDRKLSRIVEVAKERLDRVKTDQERHERYEVGFLDQKELRVESLENILSLDNSNKNPITSILATFELKADDETVHGIKIGFSSKDRFGESIFVSAISEDLGWLQETMGAIEEQLDRTIPNDFAYSINKRSATFVVMLVAMLLAVFTSLFAPKAGQFKVPQNRIEELMALSSTAKTEAEKTEFVFRYLSATLERDTTTETVTRLAKDYRTYLVGIPTIVGLLSALAAIFWYYPRNVFAWGDCGETYERTIERRKFLWYGVVLSLVIGVLGNLFVVGATSWNPG